MENQLNSMAGKAEDKACVLALSAILRYEPRTAKALVEKLGSAAAVFAMGEKALDELLGPFCKFKQDILVADIGKYRKELEAALSDGTVYMTWNDPAFPESLAACDDSPIGLFVRCSDEPAEIFKRPMIAVVGTRDLTPYGRQWCGRIVDALAASDLKPTIVSGLAFGIDITAHLAAMEAGLPTIAVLGGPLDRIYPAQHSFYAGKIERQPASALISEYPPGCNMLGINFISRNRIIAGLCSATVLVESKIKGGGMTTARIASSYGRDVYAVPGRIDDIHSQGCNLLIQSHTAEPISGIREFFTQLGCRKAAAKPDREMDVRKFYAGVMDAANIKTAVKLLDAIRRANGATASELAANCGIDYKDTVSLLSILESDGFLVTDVLQRCSLP